MPIRVLFVHQDVGQNVVDGLSAYERGAPFRLEAVRAKPGSVAAKLAAFAAERSHAMPDLALLELAWSDLTADTDVDALFGLVQRAYGADPKVLACTVPLTAVGKGLQAALQNRLSAGAFGERENVKRHLFNEQLRAAFAGRLFDLAKVQAGACTFEREKKTWPCADPALTDEGTPRLNAKGRKLAAKAFVAAVQPQR